VNDPERTSSSVTRFIPPWCLQPWDATGEPKGPKWQLVGHRADIDRTSALVRLQQFGRGPV